PCRTGSTTPGAGPPSNSTIVIRVAKCAVSQSRLNSVANSHQTPFSTLRTFVRSLATVRAESDRTTGGGLDLGQRPYRRPTAHPNPSVETTPHRPARRRPLPGTLTSDPPQLNTLLEP